MWSRCTTGGVLSPLLFNIALRHIEEAIPEGTNILQFADDILLYSSDDDINVALAHIESAIDRLVPYLKSLGFSISPGKSQFCIFSRNSIDLSNETIRVVDQQIINSINITYLGVIMDKRLNWQDHIDELAQRASKSLNIIRTLTKVTYGAHPDSMMTIYRGLTRALLEWASILFMNSCRKKLKTLDKIQYSALRTIMGCMKSTPIPILLSEAGEPPLERRRSLLINRNLVRVSSWNENPVSNKIESILIHTQQRKQLPKYLTNFSLIKNYTLVNDLMTTHKKPQKASYFDVNWSTLIFDIGNNIDRESGYEIKSTENPNETVNLTISKHYNDYTIIYTDGSYSEKTGKAGCGIYIPDTNFRRGDKLAGCFSPIMSELNGIHTALKLITTLNFQNTCIMTDSLRSLQLIKDRFSDNETRTIIHEISGMIQSITDQNNKIVLLWIPSHSGIRGNEEADRLSRIAAELRYGWKSSFSKEDWRNLIDKDFNSTNRLEWPYFPITRTRQVYFNHVTSKTERPWFKGYDLSRRAINLITRLRTGHVCVGELFLRLGWNIPPGCKCGFETSSIDHYLKDCTLFSDGRERFSKYLLKIFNSRSLDLSRLVSLIYNPNLEAVTEISDFLYHENVII